MTKESTTMFAFSKCLARYETNTTSTGISIGLCIWKLLVPFICLVFLVVFAIFVRRLYISKYY